MASPSGASDSDPLRQGLLRYVAFTSELDSAGAAAGSVGDGRAGPLLRRRRPPRRRVGDGNRPAAADDSHASLCRLPPAGDVGEAFKPFIARRLYLCSYAVRCGPLVGSLTGCCVRARARLPPASEAPGCRAPSCSILPTPRHPQVVAAYGLLDVADKGRRAYAAEAAATASTSGRHAAGPTRLPATAAAAAAAAASAPALAPELQPLRGVSPASASRALAHTAAGVAAACAACLPPRAAYAAAAASIHEQRPSTAPVAAAVLDTALWHGAASLALPAVLINRCVN